MEKDNTQILDSIRKIRKIKGFSQDYMASKLDMKQVGYGLIENGARGLQFEMLSQIAVVFGMSVIDLIAYPDVYVKKTDENAPSEPIEAILQIKLRSDTKDQVLKLVFGEQTLEILNNQK